MPHRKLYRDPPHVMREEIKNRFLALMKPKAQEDKWAPRGGWQLWRWDNLQDVPQWLSR